jgi:hypothetical protein
VDFLAVLRQEEAKLEKQLVGIRGAIAALNGRGAPTSGATKRHGPGKRVLSAAARAKISRAAKERWAKVRAEKSKKAK